MSFRVLSLAAALLSAAPASAQAPLPVVQARSRVVTIVDGLHVKKDYWYVMPERSPDVYYVEIPRQPHTVTFTTDLGSISFDVTFGSRHELVIKLEDGTEARTEVRAEYRQLITPRPSADGGLAHGPFEIPFSLGDNDKIYVKGTINGGSALDFQVDLGAGGSLIKKASVPKVTMAFDGSITLRNSDGEHVVPSSSRNRLEIAGLQWDEVPFAVADNMTWREDGLVGNSLFQDKVIAIDYDRRVIAVHDNLPDVSLWRRADVILDGVVPFVRGTLSAGGVEQKGWFILDTGAYTSILNHERLSSMSRFAHEFRQPLGPLGGASEGPVISFAGQTFIDTNYSAQRFNGNPADLGVLGNDVLKRVNLVLDNRQGAVYVRPNARAGDRFRNPERLIVRGLLTTLAVASVVLVWRARR